MIGNLATIADPDLDLPLAGTPVSRVLAWIAGALIGLITLTVAVIASSQHVVAAHDVGSRLVSVALPPPADAANAAGETDRVLSWLRRVEGVAAASLVPAEELDQAVEPWLGSGAAKTALPLPRLIDVTFNPGAAPDLGAMRAHLAEFVPGARVEDVSATGGSDDGPARFVRILVAGIGLALVSGLIATVAVVTVMSLRTHADTVDLLRLMGAGDAYVARQFEQHALAAALRGSVVGFPAAIALLLTYMAICHLAPALGAPALGLRPLDWILLAGAPVLMALLITLAARTAAQWGVRRLGGSPRSEDRRRPA